MAQVLGSAPEGAFQGDVGEFEPGSATWPVEFFSRPKQLRYPTEIHLLQIWAMRNGR